MAVLHVVASLLLGCGCSHGDVFWGVTLAVERVKASEAAIGLHCSDGCALSIRDTLGHEQSPERVMG